MKLSKKQVSARSYYFGELVADYFKAFGFYPKFHELRVLFVHAKRKACFY